MRDTERFFAGDSDTIKPDPQIETPPRGRRRAGDAISGGVNATQVMPAGTHCQGSDGRNKRRVLMYVDGFNLYFGLRSKGWRKYYWLDLCALASALMKPDQQLDGVHYFTSRIRVTARNAGTVQRQAVYLEALDTRPKLQTHLGHYLEKSKRCHTCGASWIDYEEKMTDVNIAVQMLFDAVHDRFDTAILVSGDSDLTTPLKRLRMQYPDKRLIIAFPPGRHSCELKNAAHATFTIGESNLRKSQLPQCVVRADNYVLERPSRWR